MASMHSHGVGTRQNKRLAAAWYLKAAQDGDATAMFNLGVFRERGIGLSADLKLARSWFRKASRRGHPDAELALKELGRPANRRR